MGGRQPGRRLAAPGAARQTARLADAGLTAYVGTELEFLVFRDTYEQAWSAGYRNLTPANQYNVDYSLLGTARIEPLLRRIRNDMAGAGLVVESAKGECNLGQHEIAFRYDEARRTCDDHVIYKNGAKEIAAQEGMALTFMAKFDAREGNSCHIHCSFRGTDGATGAGRRRRHVRRRAVLRRRAARVHARADAVPRAEHQLLQALRRGLLRPDRAALGPRQPHLRAPAGRATAPRCGWRTGCPAAT